MRQFIPSAVREDNRKTYRLKYLDYLDSEHWKELRKAKFALTGYKCECCGRKERIQLHHINYRNWYDCTPDDLIALCHSCHTDLHSAMAVNGTRADHYDRAQTVDLIRSYRKREREQPLVPKLSRRERRLLQKLRRRELRVRKHHQHGLSAFQRRILHKAERGRAFVVSGYSPEKRQELDVLVQSGKLHLANGLYQQREMKKDAGI